MPTNALATYLADHLAGSVAGIDLADGLAKVASGADATWLHALRRDLESAQAELRAVMDRAHAREAPLKQAGSWFGAKAARVKLAVTSAADGAALAWLDGLEALALGLQGQAALWRALDATLGADDPRRSTSDFAALERRALLLFAEVDRARLVAAAKAFT
jgi:hypothetical protein